MSPRFRMGSRFTCVAAGMEGLSLDLPQFFLTAKTVFYLLFGCRMANFRLLSRRKPR